MEPWHELVLTGRPLLAELCCEPTSILTQTCQDLHGQHTAFRMSHWNGYDLETAQGVSRAKECLEKQKPRYLWIATECGPFSPIQHLNKRTPQQEHDLEQKQTRARKQYTNGREVARHAAQLGITVIWEWSERCEAWKHPEQVEFMELMGMKTYVCKGCQVGLREPSGKLLCKGWKLATSHHGLGNHMNLLCPGNHAKGKCEGYGICRQTAFYTSCFAKRVVKFLARHEPWCNLLHELQEGPVATDMETILVASHETEEKPLTQEEKKKYQQLIHRIHCASGHCSHKYLIQALQKRGVSKQILKLAQEHTCDSCKELKRPDPRHQSTLQEVAGKWETLQVDFGQWEHPETHEIWHFILGVDEGSRLRVGHMVHHGKHYHVNAEDVTRFLQERWFPFFGQPKKIRADPDGAWRNLDLDGYLAGKGIGLEFIAAEAHWQLAVVERCIQSTKAILDALSNECPEMDFPEMFCRALWAQNQRDLYLGYSPIQHAFGRSLTQGPGLCDMPLKDLPVITENGVSAQYGEDLKGMFTAEKAFIEQQVKERIKRATQSGHRPLRQVFPGDLVFAWRKQSAKKDDKGKMFKTGKFVGPYRVLATETKSDGEVLMPGQNVWLYRGNRLTRACLSQLRPASAREEAYAELETPNNIPWTVSAILRDSNRKVYDDIIPDKEDMPQELKGYPKDMDMDDVEIVRNPKFRHTGKKPFDRSRSPTIRIKSRMPEAPETQGNSSRDKVTRQMQEQPGPRPKQARLEQVELAYSLEPSPFWNDPKSCVEVEVPLPQWHDKKAKTMRRDFCGFVNNQIKRNHMEVNQRTLSQQELEQFQAAKRKEVNNYVLAEVFEKLPDHVKPDRNQAMHMRWILTWKFSHEQERKAKARCVILGYQDPQYEFRPTASPTMNKTTRQLFLQSCAMFKFKVHKGDVSGAFLQGDQFLRDVLCVPVDELCVALGVPPKSIMKLRKAAYGLVEAPLQWYLSISAFLEPLGLERTVFRSMLLGLV